MICRLALDLGMPISELGERMSNYELTVIWPAYYRTLDAERQLLERKSGNATAREVFG